MFPDLITPLTNAYTIISCTRKLMQGNLWPLVEETLSLGNDTYKEKGEFTVLWPGKIVVSTSSKQDEAILKYPRYCDEVKGGYGWDTFARICFGWENLIMAESKKHAAFVKVLGPLFSKKSVRDAYFSDLKAVTQASVYDWAEKNQGINLLDAALEYSCKSVTTCFLGKEATRYKEIIGAVQNLMKVFWDNAQMKPWALIYQLGRKIFAGCWPDSDKYWYSHAVLEWAILEAQNKNKADENSFLGRLTSEGFRTSEIVDNMKMLYFAGTETTGSSIATLLGQLAAHQEEQEKLRKELHEANVYSVVDLDYETLHKLPRLRAALYEALRLVPPLPIQVRKVQTESESYAYFIDHYHRLRDCQKVGPYPEQFNPERCLNNQALIDEIERAFGWGLTPCLGKNFALTETLLLVASIILQGSLELVEGDPNVVIREAGAHIDPSLKIRIHLKKD